MEEEQKASSDSPSALQESALNAKDVSSAGNADQPVTLLLAAGQHSSLHSVLKVTSLDRFERRADLKSLTVRGASYSYA